MTDSLHIIGSRSSGGAERFFARLVTALAENGGGSCAVTPPGSAVQKELGPDVPRVELAMRGIWDLWARRNIRKLVERRHPAIVQTWMGRATRLTHLRPGSGSIHVARLGGYYNPKGYWHAQAWVGNTRGICDYLIREGLPSNRVFHIGNFYEPRGIESAPGDTSLRESLGISPETIVVLTTGRLHANKGFPDLLAAISRSPIAMDGRPLVFVIVGDGPEAEALGRLADELGVGQQIRWTGWRDDPAPYYGLADVFVCPSRHEPLGNVILEAWHHGVPIIATSAQGPSELITHEEDGLLVPCRDPVALARTLEKLLGESAGVRAGLAERGRQTLLSHYGRAAITAAYSDLYTTLVSQH